MLCILLNCSSLFSVNHMLAPLSKMKNNPNIPIESILNILDLNELTIQNKIVEETIEKIGVNQQIVIKRIRLSSQKEMYEETGLPKGNSILRKELADTSMFDLIYYENKLIGIIPIKHEHEDSEKYKYLNLSLYHFNFNSFNKMSKEEKKVKLIEFVHLWKKMNQVLNQYMIQTGRVHFKPLNDSSALIYLQLNPQKQPFILKKIDLDQVVDEIRVHNLLEVDHIFFPVFPTVYIPGSHFGNIADIRVDQDLVWYQNLSHSLKYWVEKELLPDSKNVYIIGPGSGIESIIVGQEVDLNQLFVSGINPFEVANTLYLLEILDIPHQVKLFDNHYDSTNDFLIYAHEDIDIIIWNMPVYNEYYQASNNRRYEAYHDHLNGVDALNQLVSGLSKRYPPFKRKKVLVIVWNNPSVKDVDYTTYQKDPVEKAFEKIAWKVIDTNNDSLGASGYYYVAIPNYGNQKSQEILKAA